MRFTTLCLAFLLILSLGMVSAARPSRRLLRQGLERSTSEEQVHFRFQEYRNSGWGLRVTYPKSWLAPSDEGTTDYDYVRLIPHDLQTRRNRILELSIRSWKTEKDLSLRELDAFAREWGPKLYPEFWIMNAAETSVAGVTGWSYRITSMSGERHEVWFATRGRVFALGYRSLMDFFASDKEFFFDPFVASAKLFTAATSPSAASSARSTVKRARRTH